MNACAAARPAAIARAAATDATLFAALAFDADRVL